MPVRNVEREVELLKQLRSSKSDEASRVLKKALGDKINVIVAKAAALIAEMQLRILIPDLCTTFERLLVDPLKRDPKCWGKQAIAKALKDLGHPESEIFLKGIRHVQLEPVWGGEEDSATTLRAACAMALLQCTDLTREDKLWAVMPLLTEVSPSLRKDGAVALESLEGREAALLLRIKARMGDRDCTVTGQVFESLLRVEREASVPFIVEFLKAPNQEVREEAALALGNSRLASAVAALKDLATQKHPLLDHEILFRALSISRHEDAIQFLLDIVRTHRIQEAILVLEALTLYEHSAEIRAKIKESVAHRSENEIQVEFERLFPEP